VTVRVSVHTPIGEIELTKASTHGSRRASITARPNTTSLHGVISKYPPKWAHGSTAPIYKKIAFIVSDTQATIDTVKWTDRIEELIDDILERMVLRLYAKPVIPGEAVSNNKAT
jgi:hypothetical protein